MNAGTCRGQRAQDGGTMEMCRHSDEAGVLRINTCLNLCVCTRVYMCVKFLFHGEKSYVNSQQSKRGKFDLES